MDANERTLLRAKAITEPLIGKALDALDAAEAERDAWRAATGLRGLSPQAAGAQIDREDDERDALEAIVDEALPRLQELEEVGRHDDGPWYWECSGETVGEAALAAKGENDDG